MSKINARQGHQYDPANLMSPKVGPMVCMWLALLFLVAGWLGITPIYMPPHWSAAIFFVVAVALFAVSIRHTDIAPLPRVYLGFLIPLAFSIAYVPWPYNVGSVLLAASLVLIVAGEQMVGLRRVAFGLGASGLAMLIQSAVQPALFQVSAELHGSSWAAEMVQLVLRAVGARVSVSGSVLHQQTFEGLRPVNITWEALGLYTVLSLMIVGTVLMAILRAGRTRWLAFLAISVIYQLVRYPILLLAYEENAQMTLFWSSWVTVATFAPLALLIGVSITRGLRIPERLDWPEPSFGRATLRSLALGGVAAICIIGLFSFQDPGTRKQGRVLIDEAHSNWEWTTRKYDTKWYNEASGYNYYCLADYLSHFYQVDRGHTAITPELLKGYDVLILKTLTKPLQQEEIDAIVDFVRAGGGLWLVGDHTNVFGMSAHMNPLAQRFGMSYRYDATYDLSSGGLSVYRPPVMLPHPTVQHMPSAFLFGTSCTIHAGLGATYPIIGYGLRALRADYARENFFPENKPSLDQEFGLLPQAVAIGFGRGRVAAWTDSTVFSNFWFFMPGKSEACLGTINWLNYNNKWGFLRWLFGIAAGLALYFGVRRPRGASPTLAIAWLLCGALIGVPLGTLAFAAASRASYPVPTPRREVPRIAFEKEHCNYTLPSDVWDTSVNLENNYHTFFTWTQRVGCAPSYIPSLDAALTNAKVLVLVNPNKDFSPQELLRIKRYMEAGGRVLVLDGAHNKGSTANRLLENYGIAIEEALFPQSWLFDRNKVKVAAAQFPRPVRGGEPILRMALDKSFLTAAKVGKGLIAVIGSSHMYADNSMGNTSTVPSAYQSGLYETEFWLFRNLMKGSSDPRLWDVPKPFEVERLIGPRAKGGGRGPQANRSLGAS